MSLNNTLTLLFLDVGFSEIIYGLSTRKDVDLAHLYLP